MQKDTRSYKKVHVKALTRRRGEKMEIQRFDTQELVAEENEEWCRYRNC